MTEADDHLFCLITMNHHPLHINDVYAGESQQGRNVVVGPLVYSLALGMSVSDVSARRSPTWPPRSSATPRRCSTATPCSCESEVLEVRASQSKPDRGTVKVHTRVYNQDGDAGGGVQARWCWCPRKDPAARSPQRNASDGAKPLRAQGAIPSRDALAADRMEH